MERAYGVRLKLKHVVKACSKASDLLIDREASRRPDLFESVRAYAVRTGPHRQVIVYLVLASKTEVSRLEIKYLLVEGLERNVSDDLDASGSEVKPGDP